MVPRGVLETCLYAGDLEAAERFYTAVLGFPVIVREPGRHVFFRVGQGVLLIFDPVATETPQAAVAGSVIPSHGARGPGHVAFAVGEAEVEPWRQRLKELGVAVEVEVAWPQGGHSLYLRDPAGNSVELATPRIWGLPETRHDSAVQR